MKTIDEQIKSDSEWARGMMRYLGEGTKDGDPEGWHLMADDFLLACIGKFIDDDTADLIRSWFERGHKWYA